MGETYHACFQADGKVPSVSDCWNKWDNIGEISLAVFFKKSRLILSRPGDLLMSQFTSRFITPCRVISIPAIEGQGDVLISRTLYWSCKVKNDYSVFRISAFSKGSVLISPLGDFRLPMSVKSWCLDLIYVPPKWFAISSATSWSWIDSIM